jgi:acyl-CoA synthetase (AMP-forming)/AMP-acid ligase II
VLAHVAEHRVTDTLLVPTMLQAMVTCPTLSDYDCSSLRRILYGASPASEALLDRAMQAFPGADFLQGYGMTETAALIAVLPVVMHGSAGRLRNRLRSCGRSTYHVQVRVVDNNDHDIPCGEVGEIIACGPNIMQGYLNQPAATAEALRGGWMHTGDMGTMDDEGYLYIVDRSKDMIISGGENVYSVEVENVIARHPAVAACAVIGIPCTEMGEKVHAAVVLRVGMSLTLEALHAHCKTTLAGYKCPRSLALHDSLPLSGAGKILKTELRKPYWSGRDRAVS